MPYFFARFFLFAVTGFDCSTWHLIPQRKKRCGRQLWRSVQGTARIARWLQFKHPWKLNPEKMTLVQVYSWSPERLRAKGLRPTLMSASCSFDMSWLSTISTIPCPKTRFHWSYLGVFSENCASQLLCTHELNGTGYITKRWKTTSVINFVNSQSLKPSVQRYVVWYMNALRNEVDFSGRQTNFFFIL